MGVTAPVLSRAVKGNPTQAFTRRYQDALDAISRDTTPQQIAEIARPIALRHHVNELYLFGSMARGEGMRIRISISSISLTTPPIQ